MGVGHLGGVKETGKQKGGWRGWHDYTYEGQHADNNQDRWISSVEQLSFTFESWNKCEKSKPAAMHKLTYSSYFYQTRSVKGMAACPMATSDCNKL